MKPLGSVLREGAIIIALIIGFLLLAASMGRLYDACGPLCWQGLHKAERDHA